MFIKDNGSGGDDWRYKSCKAAVKSSPPTNQLFTGRMPFLSPNQQCQIKALKGKISHSKDLLTQAHLGSSNFVFDHLQLLVTLGRVAMPVISPLMPVPQQLLKL